MAKKGRQSGLSHSGFALTDLLCDFSRRQAAFGPFLCWRVSSVSTFILQIHVSLLSLIPKFINMYYISPELRQTSADGTLWPLHLTPVTSTTQ